MPQKHFHSSQIILLCGSFIILAFLTLMVITKNPTLIAADQSLRRLVNAHRNPATTYFFTHLTQLYNLPGIAIITSLLIGGSLFLRQWRISLQFFLTIFIGNGLNHWFKSLIMRPRPQKEVLMHYSGWSFPSGHSCAVMVTAGTLIMIILRSHLKRDWQLLLASLLVLLILLIGWSRIYVGAHYPTDVLGGWTLGIIVINLVDLSLAYPPIRCFKPKHRPSSQNNP